MNKNNFFGYLKENFKENYPMSIPFLAFKIGSILSFISLFFPYIDISNSGYVNTFYYIFELTYIGGLMVMILSLANLFFASKHRIAFNIISSIIIILISNNVENMKPYLSTNVHYSLPDLFSLKGLVTHLLAPDIALTSKGLIFMKISKLLFIVGFISYAFIKLILKKDFTKKENIDIGHIIGIISQFLLKANFLEKNYRLIFYGLLLTSFSFILPFGIADTIVPGLAIRPLLSIVILIINLIALKSIENKNIKILTIDGVILVLSISPIAYKMNNYVLSATIGFYLYLLGVISVVSGLVLIYKNR